MSLDYKVRGIRVLCDVEGCKQEFSSLYLNYSLYNEKLRDGWQETYTGGVSNHYCPEHREDLEYSTKEKEK